MVRPRSLPEFAAEFGNEEACAEYLIRHRWPDGVVCPACGSARAFQLKCECPTSYPQFITRAEMLDHCRSVQPTLFSKESQNPQKYKNAIAQLVAYTQPFRALVSTVLYNIREFYFVFVVILMPIQVEAENYSKGNIEDVSKEFNLEIKNSIKIHHDIKNDEQKIFYSEIVRKYFYSDMSVEDAVFLLKKAGFSITVFGDGFYTYYPSNRGNAVSGCFYFKEGFLSGGSLCVNLTLYHDGDFRTVKNVDVGVGSISP